MCSVALSHRAHFPWLPWSGCLFVRAWRRLFLLWVTSIPKETEQPPSDDSLSTGELCSSSTLSTAHLTTPRTGSKFSTACLSVLVPYWSILDRHVLSFRRRWTFRSTFAAYLPLCLPSCFFVFFCCVSLGALQSQKIQKDTVVTLLSAF